MNYTTLDSYKTYALGPIDDINNCPWVLLVDSVATPVSPYNAQSILDDTNEKKGWIGNDFIERGTDGKFEIDLEQVDTDEGSNYSGFDAIIYISAKKTALGYTKFTNHLGKGIEKLRLRLDVKANNTVGEGSFSIIAEVSKQGIEREHKKYSSTLASAPELRENLNPALESFSTHISSAADIILSNYSVHLGGESPEIAYDDLFSSRLYYLSLNQFIENPDSRRYEFSSHSVGYYGGNDIVLNSWTPEYYSIISLTQTDTYGRPVYYTTTKEGRRPAPKFGDIETEISYISGRWIVCALKTTGSLRVYDTVSEGWLNLSGWPVSNPQDVRNRVYDLSTPNMTIEEYKQYIPSLGKIYSSEDLRGTKFRSIKLMGDWVILQYGSTYIVASTGGNVYTDILESDLKNLVFLDSYTLLKQVGSELIDYETQEPIDIELPEYHRTVLGDMEDGSYKALGFYGHLIYLDLSSYSVL